MSDPYDEFLARATQQAPSTGPVPVRTGAGVDAYDEFISRSKAEPAPAAPAARGTDPYDEFISRGPAPAAEPRGYLAELGHLAAGGVDRNIAQWQSMPDQLLGVYHEAQGDLEKAKEYSLKAQATQAPAGESEWSLQKIHDPETFSYWMAEKLGEQSITALATLATGGTAGLGASALSQNLLTRGLISSGSARAMMLAGMGVPTYALTTAMETAGTAEEQFQVTGSTQPGRSLAAGATKGLLELWTPLSISRALLTPGLQLGRSLPGAIGKLAAKEAATETAQEAVDVYARQLAEPGYSYFKDGPTLAPSGWGEGMWRLAESGAAGGLVGAAFGGPAAVMERRQERNKELGNEPPGFSQTVQEGRVELPAQEVIAKDNVQVEKDGRHWTASSQFGDVFAVLDRVPGGTFALRVQSSGLQREADIGQGHGAILYKTMFDQALAAGYPVHSDGVVSENAAKVYQAFAKFGYTVEGPKGQLLKDAGGNFYHNLEGPVFKITAAPSAKLSQEVRLRIFPTANKVEEMAARGRVKTSLMRILPGIIDNDKGLANEEPPRGHPDREKFLQDKMNRYYRQTGKVEAERRRSEFRVVGPVTALHNAVVPKKPGDKLTQEVRAKDPRDDALGVGAFLLPDRSSRRQRMLDAVEAATERYIDLGGQAKGRSLIAASRINGRNVYTGAIHVDSMRAAREAGEKLDYGQITGTITDQSPKGNIEQGFLTENGYFVTRKEAEDLQGGVVPEIGGTQQDIINKYGFIHDRTNEIKPSLKQKIDRAQQLHKQRLEGKHTLDSRVYTNTEWELENATNRKQSEKPRLLKVNQQSLQPAAITAQLTDLPDVGSERVWFLPGVNAAEKQQLLRQYANMQRELPAASGLAMARATARNQLEESFRPIYDKLLTAGLRVIPSHGSGFYYNGVVEGEEISDLKSSRRGREVAWYNPETREITPFSVDPLKTQDGAVLVSIDRNKVADEDFENVQVGEGFSEVYVLKKPLDLSKLTPGIQPLLDQFDGLFNDAVGFREKSWVEVSGIQRGFEEYARRIQLAVNGLLGPIDAILRSVGINQGVGIQITDNKPVVNGQPIDSSAWVFVNSGVMGISPENLETNQGMVDTERKVLSAIMHELGHMVTFWYYRNLPVAMQDKLQYAWEKSRLALRMGDPSRVMSAVDNPGLNTLAHWSPFSEWLAEQFRRWATSNAEPKSWLDKTYQEGGKQLEKFYRGWEQRFGEKQASNLAEPDHYFSGVMDYLRETAKEVVDFKQLMKREALFEVNQALLDSPVKFQVLKQFALGLRSLQDIAVPGQMLRINEVLDPALTPAGDIISPRAGARYIRSANGKELGMLEMALSSLKSEAAYDTARQWYTHESWHSYRDLGLVTPQEIGVLMQDIKGHENELFSEDDRKALYQKVKAFGEMRGWTREQINVTYRLMRDEEYQAYYMQRVIAEGKPAYSEEGKSILAWFAAVMERLQNFFKGLGYQTKEDVLRAFFRGEMVARYETRLQDNAVESWQAEQQGLTQEVFGFFKKKINPNEDELDALGRYMYEVRRWKSPKPIEIVDPDDRQAVFQIWRQNGNNLKAAIDTYKSQPKVAKSAVVTPAEEKPETAFDRAMRTSQQRNRGPAQEVKKKHHRYAIYTKDHDLIASSDNPAEMEAAALKAGEGTVWIDLRANLEKTIKGGKFTEVREELMARDERLVREAGQEDMLPAERQKPTLHVEKTFVPAVKSVEVEPGIEMHVSYMEGVERRNAKGRLYNAAVHYLFTSGDKLVGSASLKNRGDRGYEISNVSAQAANAGRLAFLNSLLKHVAKDVGIPLFNPQNPQDQLAKPAGMLSAGAMPSYRLGLRKTEMAGWLDLYVFDNPTQTWYSPNAVVKHGAYWKLENIRSKQGRSQHTPEKIAEMLALYTRLYAKVPQETWQDPRLRQMFVLDRNSKRDEVQGALIRAGQQVEESKLMASLGYGSPLQDVFQATFEMKQAFSQAENAKASQLPFEMSAPASALTFEVRRTWDKLSGYKYGESAEVRKTIMNTFHEADRIGWFSKHAWTIWQLIWSNEKIVPLTSLGQNLMRMNTLMNGWLRRADDTARIWRRITNFKRREGITNTLFGLTEMKYRLPIEEKNKIIRMPSNWEEFLAGQQAVPNGELDRFFKKMGLDPQDQSMIRRTANDFAAYLRDVEAVILKNLERKLANSPAALAVAIAEVQKEFIEMRAKPYFPTMRWGEYTIKVKDAQTKEILEFQAFGTRVQRDSAVPEMKKKHPAADIQIGRVAASAIEFMALPSPLLKLIREKLFSRVDEEGNLKPAAQLALIDEQMASLEEFEMLNRPDRTFRKRWMPAHGIPGYNTDAFRAYASYFQYGSRYLSRLAYMDELYDDLAALQKSKEGLGNTASREEIIKYVRNWLKYIMEPGRDSGKFRAFVSLWYLGFSPAAAAMNFTQTLTTTLPTLHGHFGREAVTRAMTSGWTASKNVWRTNAPAFAGGSGVVKGEPSYLRAREEMLRQQQIDVGQAPELAAFAEGGNLAKLQAGTKTQEAWLTTLNWGMKMFQVGEQFNRELAFKLSWDLANKHPQTKRLTELDVLYPIEIKEIMDRAQLTHQEAVSFVFAREMIMKTQLVYDKTSDAPFMRGKSKDFLIFFKYTQQMLYAFGNNGAMLQMLLVFAFLYGLNGLPGAEDAAAIVDMLDAIGRKLFGKDFRLRYKAREFFTQATAGTPFEKVGPDLALHGVSRYGFGMSFLPQGFAPQFDASSNGSMGRIIPGFAEFMHGMATGKKWPDVFAEAAQKASGAGYGTFFSLMHFLSEGPSADSKKWESLLPRSLKAEAKAWRYGFDQQAETTRSGAKLPSARFFAGDPDDVATVLAQAFGFQPRKVSQTWEKLRAVGEEEEIYRGRRTAIYVQMDKALMEKNEAAIAEVKVAIDRYNADVKNFDPAYQIGRELSASLMQRKLQRAMVEETSVRNKKQITIMERMQKLYPGVEVQKVK